MAKLELETPVKSIRGKISSYERIITRTRNGKTHSYIVHKPYKGPHSEKQTQAFSTFAEAVNRCKQEMNDPEKLAAWLSKTMNSTASKAGSPSACKCPPYKSSANPTKNLKSRKSGKRAKSLPPYKLTRMPRRISSVISCLRWIRYS